MPNKDIRPFKPGLDNTAIMNAIRNQASNAYQDRVPETTKANLQANIRHLTEHAGDRNEFMNSLVNRIGDVIARNNNWTNPLGKFKRGMMTYGDTIEEVQIGLVEAYVYDPQREYLERDIFGQSQIESQSSFHKITRQEFYKVTINETMLSRAFLEPNGLSQLVSQIMEAPSTSDQWDEFLQTCALFSEYERNGGFHKIKVPDVAALNSNEADAKGALRTIRTAADNLTFISRDFNAAGMPVSASRDDLELFVSPEFNAAIDVEALAAAFNIERANIPSRTTVIPQQQFGIDGAQAILTTKDFFVIADTKFETTSMINPVGLHTNHFLHHHQIISASRFVPAILFTSNEAEVITIIDTPVTSVANITAENRKGEAVTTFERGEFYNINSDAVTTPAGGKNDGVRFTIAGEKADGTFLSQNGSLFVAPNESATQLAITATATGTETDADPISKTATYALDGDIIEYWPHPKVTTPPATQ